MLFKQPTLAARDSSREALVRAQLENEQNIAEAARKFERMFRQKALEEEAQAPVIDLSDKIDDLASVLGVDPSKINAQLVAKLLATKTVEPEKPKAPAKANSLALDNARAIDFNL